MWVSAAFPPLFLGHPLENLRHQLSPGRCLPNTGTLSRTWFWCDTFHRERPSMRSGKGDPPGSALGLGPPVLCSAGSAASAITS